MADFSFIVDPELRQALEADYAELGATIQAQAWKAAHVMAGSVIEAVLVYYLVSTKYQNRNSQDPLKMSFDDLIGACKREHILTDKTADLSSAIKRYRNLIHPGRALRLEESADDNGARVAQSLVEIIVKEIGANSRKVFGYNAQQLLSKVESDPSAITILEHLLAETNSSETERLLTQLLPRRYFELRTMPLSENDNYYEHQRRLKSLTACFRATLDLASVETKENVGKMLAETIKIGTQDRVYIYEEAFFMGKDLEHYRANDASLVKQHILSRIEIENDPDLRVVTLVQFLSGIGPYLSVEDDMTALISTVLWHLEREGDSSHAEELSSRIWIEYWSMEKEVQSAFMEGIQFCRSWYTDKGNSHMAEQADKLASNLKDIPF